MITNTSSTPAPPVSGGAPGSPGRFRRWLRRIVTNRLDEDWEELHAMSDEALCAEFDRVLDSPRTDRFRRVNYVMGLRFYKGYREANTEVLAAPTITPTDT